MVFDSLVFQRKQLFCVLALLVAVLSCRKTPSESQPTPTNKSHKQSDPLVNKPVIRMPFVTDWASRPIACIYKAGIGHSHMGQSISVIVAIWKNGQMIWSDDAINGGPPYRSGKTEIQKVDAMLNGFEKGGIFENSDLNIPNFGPDSGFHVIAIMDEDRCLNMASWHELFEDNANLVATSEGITTLDGRNRDEVLAAEPDEYRYYRKVWKDIRITFADLIPSDGALAPGLHFTR